MSELKPCVCPICGGEIEIVRIGGGWFWQHKSQEAEGMCEITHNRKHVSEAEAFKAWNRRAQPDNEPLTLERFEEVCESVHNGWWEEKKRQGVTDHPDMIPYGVLSEDVKEYDRVTVRRVLDALGLAYRRPPLNDAHLTAL